MLYLYVTQIPADTTESDIHAHFSKFGSVSKLYLAKGKGEWKKLNAKVELDTELSYPEILNLKHSINHCKVKVDQYLSGRELAEKTRSEAKWRVSLFRIKGNVTDLEIISKLSTSRVVESYYFIKCKEKKDKKYGFVTFEDEAAARYWIGQGKLRVGHIDIKIKPYKVSKGSAGGEQARHQEVGQAYSRVQGAAGYGYRASRDQRYPSTQGYGYQEATHNETGYRQETAFGDYPAPQMRHQHAERRSGGAYWEQDYPREAEKTMFFNSPSTAHCSPAEGSNSRVGRRFKQRASQAPAMESGAGFLASQLASSFFKRNEMSWINQTFNSRHQVYQNNNSSNRGGETSPFNSSGGFNSSPSSFERFPVRFNNNTGSRHNNQNFGSSKQGSFGAWGLESQQPQQPRRAALNREQTYQSWELSEEETESKWSPSQTNSIAEVLGRCQFIDRLHSAHARNLRINQSEEQTTAVSQEHRFSPVF